MANSVQKNGKCEIFQLINAGTKIAQTDIKGKLTRQSVFPELVISQTNVKKVDFSSRSKHKLL